MEARHLDRFRLSRLVLGLWRSIYNYFLNIYQYLQVIFGSTGHQGLPPSSEVVEIANSLFDVLELKQNGRIGDEEPGEHEENPTMTRQELLDHIAAMLDECLDLDSLLQVTNDSGYNALQLAVLRNDIEIIQLLAEQGVDLNGGKCSPPLPLAAKLGNKPMVDLLLRRGCKTDAESGICYPEWHTPIKHVPSRFHFLETDIYLCDSGHQLPLMYAIEGDHVEIVHALLNHASSKWPRNRYPLHHACKHGAYRCIKYLTECRSQDINVYDEGSMTPLLHATMWGKKFVQFLVEAGSDIHATNGRQQNALHLLYANMKHPLDLYNTTKFLLGAGLEQDINMVDRYGNTPLHTLVSHVNCLVSAFSGTHKETTEDHETLQNKFDVEVLRTMEALLSFNCDPNVVNHSGVCALHRLLLTFDFVVTNDPTGITLETLPVRESYKVDFTMLCSAVETLLKHGSDPNSPTSASRSALHILLQSILNVDPGKLGLFGDGYILCITTLCQQGALPSVSEWSHKATVCTLAKLGFRCLSQRDEIIRKCMSELLQKLLALLLRHGLDSNHITSRRLNAEGGTGNILVEIVRLAQYIRQPADLLFIYDWVLTLLQWGANPDIEPYPADTIICTSQSSIFLKPKSTQAVNQYMYEIQDFRQIFEGGYAERILHLFYNSMDHDALFQCLSTAKFMSRFDPNRVPTANFIQMLNNLSAQPRSLRQMSRVAIYKAIDRQLNLKVPHLPLPRSLQSYLTNVE